MNQPQVLEFEITDEHGKVGVQYPTPATIELRGGLSEKMQTLEEEYQRRIDETVKEFERVGCTCSVKRTYNTPFATVYWYRQVAKLKTPLVCNEYKELEDATR